MLVWMICYASLNHLQPNPVWWDIIISQSVICEKWVSVFKVKVTVTEFRFIQSNMTISIICSELLIFWGDQLSLTECVHKLECLVKRLLFCGQGHSEGSELQWMFARIISLIGQTLYGDVSSSARVSFRNIILRCSRSKPQSFLLDLQKYWNFCNPN